MAHRSKAMRGNFDEGPPVEGATIQVIVGDGDKKKYFVINESLLRMSADFFDAALRNDWKEKVERKMKLSNQDPEAFTVYTKWLYTGRFYLKKADDAHTEELTKEDEGPHSPVSGGKRRNREWQRLDACYCLGDFLQNEDFQDAVLDSFVEKMVEAGHWPYKLPQFIYNSSRKDSVHRKFVAKFFMEAISKDRLEKVIRDNDDVIDEFAADVGFLAMSQGVNFDAPRPRFNAYFKELNMCDYHLHTKKNKPCYKARW